MPASLFGRQFDFVNNGRKQFWIADLLQMREVVSLLLEYLYASACLPLLVCTAELFELFLCDYGNCGGHPSFIRWS